MRIDPNILLESLLGLTIEYCHIAPQNQILGLTSFEEVGVEIYDENVDLFFFDGKTVLIESNLLAENQTGRRNFTIIHEGCHHILKMLFPNDYRNNMNARRVFCYRATSSYRTVEEQQVDQLASAVLMPRKLIKQAMFLAGLKEEIKMLNPVWRRQEYEKFCWMCQLLGVSKQALCIRMTQLGLIGESHLRHPNEIIDIY